MNNLCIKLQEWEDNLVCHTPLPQSWRANPVEVWGPQRERATTMQMSALSAGHIPLANGHAMLQRWSATYYSCKYASKASWELSLVRLLVFLHSILELVSTSLGVVWLTLDSAGIVTPDSPGAREILLVPGIAGGSMVLFSPLLCTGTLMQSSTRGRCCDSLSM